MNGFPDAEVVLAAMERAAKVAHKRAARHGLLVAISVDGVIKFMDPVTGVHYPDRSTERPCDEWGEPISRD